MQRMEASTIVRSGVAEVWARLLEPSSWARIAEAFGGGRCQAASSPPGPLGPGSELLLATMRGRPVARMRVAECVPQQKLELTAADEEHWLRKYHLTVTVTVDNPDPQATAVSVSFNAVFLNQAVELLSLILPSFVYAGRLKKALAVLRA